MVRVWTNPSSIAPIYGCMSCLRSYAEGCDRRPQLFPAGKMSYLCQLTDNRARVVGFDRNTRKTEKAREHLERLRCKNYQLIAHDSRYAHLDYTLRADKVLVDPPCTGLG